MNDGSQAARIAILEDDEQEYRQLERCILEYATEEKLLLLSSHLVEEMEAIADRAVFIRNGQLAENVDLEQMRQEKGISMADRYREIYGHTEG